MPCSHFLALSRRQESEGVQSLWVPVDAVRLLDAAPVGDAVSGKAS